jgi:small subunit ribosomal protein S21
MESRARLRASDDRQGILPMPLGTDDNRNDRIDSCGRHHPRRHQHRAGRRTRSAPPRCAPFIVGRFAAKLLHHEKEHILQVLVRDNNIDQAMRVLKKKMQREGIFREMKRRKSYEKPSERRVREKAEAVRRIRKLARKQAQREGLIPRPKPKPPGSLRAARR